MFLVIKKVVSNFLDTFLDLIYKQNCLICSCAKTKNLLCKTCLKDVNYLSGFPHKIYKEIPIYSALKYEGVTKKLIHKLKFQHKKKASIVLSNILFEYFLKLNLNKEFVIIYPPSFFLKTAQRGYEHMFLIAKEFSKNTNFKIETKLIKKIKYTKPQYNAKDRHKNIEGSFLINKKLIEKYKDKNILLIDDITTTGATLEEIINCLFKKGINNITCLTISKT